MKNYFLRAVFFLALICVVVLNPLSVSADGDEEEPTPTPQEEQEVSEDTKGGVPVYGGTTVYGGEPVYGGGVIVSKSGELLIDKMVLNPATDAFVDHLGPTDPKYRSLQIVTFRIRVENSGEESLGEVVVTDLLPDFVDFMSGPGSYDQDSRKLTFTVENLEPGESEEFHIKARASHQATLPEEKNIVCPVNIAEAVTGDRQEKDESQFCIEKEMEVEQVPETGADPFMITAIGSALSAGIWFRKKSKKD
ncbi:MAG: hypothetical protein UV73_C0001G0254 [Candidatus Gottesmanbacteria bacterium GW2011_GWA2_43_14]|uniref:DUF11 domain-containing protein n=1 Tax=Candidatus Gottesmanbacteria bacterium GW2011_GWA2_43_14 TaxID=1618443 RepID=A0A0G1GIY9_9BACT|nr:MAG: hypothetical protein UV73_C0001G0254 [Candidatus Gottesmanbacteria bacterium GW2011_GWA2_43_14]